MRNSPSRIDPSRLDLVREFWANPIGHHSVGLEAILSILRAGPVAGKLCLICTKPYQEWVLARLSGQRGHPPTTLPDLVFNNLHDAERTIFRLRWEAETGLSLPEDIELCAQPHPAGAV